MSKRILLLVLVFMLSACATKRPVEYPESGRLQEENRVLWLQQHAHWKFDGRFSIRIESGKSSEGGSGNLSWRQNADTLEIGFYGAFGRGAWQLRANSEFAELSLADGRVVKGVDVAAIIKAELGWDIPIENFSLWLRGMPGNFSRVNSRDSSGRPESITHQAWQVKYLSWMQVEAYYLPKKIELTAPGRKLKLSVKNWEF